MKYLGDKDIQNIDLDWNRNIETIASATSCIDTKDISQPIKPYLRYREPKNRIIAMPAFVGGEINRSGIKWIASFPDNIKNGKVRAHSIIILNDAETGEPVSVINSGSISAIRTASVSGFVIKKYMELNRHKSLKVGIIGFGPIGQYHLKMCDALLGDKLDEVFIYDLKDVSASVIPKSVSHKVKIVDSWEQAYINADIFITCTVSKEPYIGAKPKASSLHLNVSLRDYKTTVFPWFKDAIIVDDWNEVCRENTDVEAFHKVNGLLEKDVKPIQEVLKGWLHSIDKKQAIMFNPMGMAVFDMAIANQYLIMSEEVNTGILLEG